MDLESDLAKSWPKGMLLFAMLAGLAVITFVPATVLWLPRLLGYQG